MGITRDQVARGALNRLRDHYENMVRLKDEPGFKAMVEFDMNAWAFVRTFITSSHLLGLVSTVAYAFNNSIDLDNPPEEWGDWKEENDPDPKWGLEVLELLVRAYVLMDNTVRDYDQWSELSASYDATEMLAEYGRTRDEFVDAMLYIDPEQYREWGGQFVPEWIWLGYPNKFLQQSQKLLPRREG